MEEIKNKLSTALVKGEFFCINLDDSEFTEYNEIFDPDIKDFYSNSCFPEKIWELKKFLKGEALLQVLAGTENSFKNRASKTFKVIFIK